MKSKKTEDKYEFLKENDCSNENSVENNEKKKLMDLVIETKYFESFVPSEEDDNYEDEDVL